MKSEDIPTDRISKVTITDLLESQKSAEEIVNLWSRYVNRIPKQGQEENHDRLGNLGGSWQLKDIEVENLISLLDGLLKIQRRLERDVADHFDEIGEAKEEVHAAEKRTEDAEKNTALVKRNLIWVLGEVVNSGLPSTIRQQILENVLSKVSGLPGDELKAHIPMHFRETSNVTNVGSIVCAGERVILDKDYAIGVTGAFTEFGELVISWDNSNSADSCRAMGNENSLTIAICDGSSEGDISSRVFSRLLTTVLTEMVPLSEKARALLTGQPMVDFLRKRISHKNEKDVDVFGRVVRDFSLQDAEEAEEGLRAAGATAVNVIIHRTGWCWSSGVGDSALYLIQNGEGIKPLILSPELEDPITPLIRLDRLVKIDQGEMIKLQEGDVLIGATDFVAEYIEVDRKRLFEMVSKCKDHSSARQPSFWQNLFKNISESQDGDDDMTIFVYVHGSKELPFKNMDSSFQEAKETYTVGPLHYEAFEKDYYANQTVPKGSRKGAKRINNKIASNLRIILETLQPNWPDFLPRYEVVQTSSNDYFLLMDHYEKEEYIRLDELIESSDSSDLTKVIELLSNIEKRIDECRISHGDISPTNIIVHKDTFAFKLLDLNTLYVQGCFPHDESGHKGMYGQDGLPCIPSIYAHKFPLRSLRLSMELMKSMIDHGQAKKGIDCFSPSADEEYILESEKLRDYFFDYDGNRLDEHTDELKSKFPDMDENTIRKQLSSLSITEIYNLDSWGY